MAAAACRTSSCTRLGWIRLLVAVMLVASAGLSGAADGDTRLLLSLPNSVGFGAGAICAAQAYALLPRYHSLCRYSFNTGVLEVVAGDPANGGGYLDAVGTIARFNYVHSVAIDEFCTYAYVGDYYNHRIRRISLGTMAVSTIAGNGTNSVPHVSGPATLVPLTYPKYVGFSYDYSLLYVGAGQQLLSITLTTPTRMLAVEAGSYGVAPASLGDGTGTAASLDADAIVAYTLESVLFAEYASGRVRRFHQPSKLVTTATGKFGVFAVIDGSGTNAAMTQVAGAFALDPFTLTGFLVNKDLGAAGTPPTILRRLTFPGVPPTPQLGSVALRNGTGPAGALPVAPTAVDGVLLDPTRGRLLLTASDGIYAVDMALATPSRLGLFGGGALHIEGGGTICLGASCP